VLLRASDGSAATAGSAVYTFSATDALDFLFA
jgi:hypothetical protein